MSVFVCVKWAPSRNAAVSCAWSICMDVNTRTYTLAFCLSLPPPSLPPLTFSNMDFHFLPSMMDWVQGSDRSMLLPLNLYFRCTLFYLSSRLVICPTGEFWHVQINNHSVQMSGVTSGPTWCTQKKQRHHSWAQRLCSLMREARYPPIISIVCVCRHTCIHVYVYKLPVSNGLTAYSHSV